MLVKDLTMTIEAHGPLPCWREASGELALSHIDLIDSGPIRYKT
jgi:hypothetical protein